MLKRALVVLIIGVVTIAGLPFLPIEIDAAIADTAGAAFYRQHVMADQPTAYFRLNGTEQEVPDEMGNMGPGATGDFPDDECYVNSSVPRGLPGIFGAGADTAMKTANGTNYYIGCDDGREFNSPELTIEMWADFDELSSPGLREIYIQHPLVWQIDEDGALSARVYYGQNQSVQIDPVGEDFDEGGFHHLVLSVGDGEIRMYGDGLLLASEPFDHELYYAPSYWMRMEASAIRDELAIYDYALDPWRVVTHFGAGGGEVTPEMVLETLFGVDAETAAFAGDPVQPVAGNFVHSRIDLTFPAASTYGLDLERVYNGRDQRSGLFGKGWSHSFDASVSAAKFTAPATTNVVFRDWDGRTVGFRNTGPGTWERAESTPGSLSYDSATKRYALAWDRGETWRFDADPTNGVPDGSLVEKQNWDGQTVTLYYGVDPAVPLLVANGATGDALWFGESGTPDGRVDTVAAGPFFASNRSLAYTYDGQGELLTASWPYSTGSPTAAETTETDGPGGQISRILDGTGLPVVENTAWDSRGRVTAQATPQGDPVVFEYDVTSALLTGAVGKTRVTHGSGGTAETVDYHYDSWGRVVGITDPTNPCCGSPNSTGKTYDNGRLQDFTSRSGSTTSRAYTAGLVTRIDHPDPDGGGPGVASSEYITYNGTGDTRVKVHVNQAGEKTSYTYSGAARIPSTVSRCTGGANDAPCPGGGGTHTTSFAGTTDGLVDSMTDADGVVTAFSYTGTGCPARQLCTVMERSGGLNQSTTKYEYSPVTHLPTKVTTAQGTPDEAVTNLVYDDYAAGDTPGRGWLSEARDPLYDGSTHRATRFEYDAAGRQRKVWDPANGSSTPSVEYQYYIASADPEGYLADEIRLINGTGPVTATTHYTYTAAGLVATSTDAAGTADAATTTFTYGKLGRLEKVADPTNIETHFCYDSNGNRTKVIRPSAAGSVNCSATGVPVVTTAYDQLGRATSVTNPEGEVTAYGYDNLGRVNSVVEASGSTAVDRRTTLAYDAFGQLASVSRGDPASTLNGIEMRTYTPGGRIQRVCEAPQDVSSFAFDSACDGSGTERSTEYGYTSGLLTSVSEADGTSDERSTTVAYDYQARPTVVTTAAGTAEALATTSTYDDLGQVTKVSRPSGLADNPGTPAINESISAQATTYTPLGLLTSQTEFVHDPTTVGSHLRQYDYNAAGWLSQSRDANWDSGDPTVTYEYDLRGNRRFRRSYQTSGGPQVAEEWTYDAADRVQTEKDGMLRTTTYDWDYEIAGQPKRGRLYRTIYPTSRKQLFTYDLAGRITQRQFTGTALADITVSQVWDDRSNLDLVTRSAPTPAETTDYSRDVDGNVTQVQRTGGPHPDSVSYTWDLAGNNRQVTYPNGSQWRFGHNAHDEQISTQLNQSGSWTTIATLTRNGQGSVTDQDSGLLWAVSRDFRYDSAQNLVWYRQAMPVSADNRATKLTYDAAGRVASECAYANPTAATPTTACSPSPDDVTTYAYDPAGQLLSVTGDAGLDGVYAYDLHGNRSTFTDYTAGVGQTKDTYVYNKADQLDKINRQSWTGSAWGGSALFEDYTNDNAGRRTAMDDSDVDTIADVSYAYDERGQIATLVDGDGTWTFKHDGEGVVNEFSLGSAATPLVWDRSRLGGELLTFGPTSDFVTQVDGLGRYRSTGVQPLGQDHEGSAIKSTGYESYPQAYDPFGDPTSTTSIATSHIGYRDELQYADLVHLRNRDYDPSVGAFTTMDPLATGPNSPELGTSIPLAGGTPVETNAYHYVGNDPLNFVDPLGLCRTTDVYFDTFTNVDPDEATVVEGPEGGFGYSQCEDAGSVTCTPQPYRRELGDRAGAVRCGPRDGVPLLPNCFTWMDDCDSMATDLPGGPFNCSFMDQGCDTEHLVISVNICVLICFVYGTQDGERFWGLGGTGLSGPTVNVGAANLHICDRENTSVGASASYGGGVYAQEGWDDRAVTEDWEVGSSYGWGFAGMGGGGAVAEMHTWNTC